MGDVEKSADGEKTAFEPRRPFGRKAALAAGVTVRELRGAAYTRLHTGIFVASSVEVTPIVRAAAALVPFPATAWASHATAARCWELPIPALPHEHVSVVAKGDRRRRPDIVCHHVPQGSVQVRYGVRISSPAQTFVELAELLPLVDLVVVGDHLVRKEKCSLERLGKVCAAATSSGARAAREALGYVREGVDSPMETRLRMLIVLAGLPEPRVNPLVGDGETLEFRKYDLCWPEVKLIVEYDGRHHIEREEQWEHDLERREKIDDDGWRIIVVTSKGIYEKPGETVGKIHRLLRERGHPAVPVRLRHDWVRHFPWAVRRPASRLGVKVDAGPAVEAYEITPGREGVRGVLLRAMPSGCCRGKATVLVSTRPSLASLPRAGLAQPRLALDFPRSSGGPGSLDFTR